MCCGNISRQRPTSLEGTQQTHNVMHATHLAHPTSLNAQITLAPGSVFGEGVLQTIQEWALTKSTPPPAHAPPPPHPPAPTTRPPPNTQKAPPLPPANPTMADVLDSITRSLHACTIVSEDSAGPSTSGGGGSSNPTMGAPGSSIASIPPASRVLVSLHLEGISLTDDHVQVLADWYCGGGSTQIPGGGVPVQVGCELWVCSGGVHVVGVGCTVLSCALDIHTKTTYTWNT